MSGLFRIQAVDKAKNDIGVPLGITGMASRIFSVFLLLMMVGASVLVTCGSYARKSHVSGFLVPDRGLLKIVSSHDGHVTNLQVIEGQHVAKDQLLAAISVDAVSMLGNTGDLAEQSVKDRLDLIRAEIGRLDDIHRSEAQKLDAAIGQYKAEIAAMNEEVKARQDYLDIAENQLKRSQQLQSLSAFSVADAEKAQQAFVSSKIDIDTLQRSLSETQGLLNQAVADRSGLAQRQQNEKADLERTAEELNQQLIQFEQQRFVLIKAPESGTVTRVVTSLGGAVDQTVPLMTIVPENAVIQADLYVSSEAAGFVRPGAKVLLRYEAYPYQKFGLQDAVVTSVSRTAVDTKELPFSTQSADPVYLVTASLAKETVTAFGKEEPLQAGEKFQADIILESRKIWEWAIEPLIAARETL